MFRIVKRGSNHLDIEMRGKLDAESMRDALDELAEKSEGVVHGTMLYIVHDFHLPTLRAIGIEFSRLPSMLGLLKKFDRAAVLTDKSWLKRVSELEGALFPGVAIKGFGMDQREEAEAWLNAVDDAR